MMKRKVLLSGLLSVAALVATATPAFAAGGNSTVNIQANATTINMTVPSSAPMVFNADGTNALPESFNIVNNSEISGVHLTDIQLTNDSKTAWKLLAASEDTKTLPKNTKSIKLSMGKAGAEKAVVPTEEGVRGSITYGASDFAIPAKGTQKLSFKVERGAFTQAVTSEKAFDMTLNFDFN